MVFWTCLGLLGFLACCVFFLICSVESSPVIETVPDDINRQLLYAEWLRDQIEATAEQFVALHEPVTQYEIDELRSVIYDNPTSEVYAETLIRIMHYRYPSERGETNDVT